MKTWKLVSGILSIVFSVFVMFQSTAVGLGNAMTNSKEVSGSAGLIVAILMLAGGIVSIVVCKGGKGGSVALIVIFGLAAMIGFTNAGTYIDLNVWSAWCLICTVLALLSACMSKPSK